MTPLAAYVLLFAAVGAGFILVHLVAGRLIRPRRPHSEKGTTYECGEPTIGSAWVQFDLRFYVVALLFVVFDVEVAFFFPWAEVFGKANAVANATAPATADEYVGYAAKVQELALPGAAPKQAEYYEKITGRDGEGRPLLDEGGKPRPRLTDEDLAGMPDGPLPRGDFERNREEAKGLAWLALGEVLVFFGVLLVGFAYLWRRGDLDWVRSTTAAEVAARVQAKQAALAPEAARDLQHAGAGHNGA